MRHLRPVPLSPVTLHPLVNPKPQALGMPLVCRCWGTLQSIPKPVAALLKTTEPHSDSYYLLDLEGLLSRSGYTNVTTVLSDPRHRVVTATKARS